VRVVRCADAAPCDARRLEIAFVSSARERLFGFWSCCGRRQKPRVYQFIMLRMRFSLCTRPCLDYLLRALRGHQSARHGITMHFLKSWSAGQVQPSQLRPLPGASRTCGGLRTARVRVPLPVPRGGCARRDKRKPSERARRLVSNFVEVLGMVSLIVAH